MPQLSDQLEAPLNHSAATSRQAVSAPADPEAAMVAHTLSRSPSPEPVNPLPVAATPLPMDNGYVAGEVLGSGSTGIVIQARSHEKNGKVAIKVIDIKECPPREGLRVLREVRVTKGLKGKPNIVEFYDVKTNEDCILIIMEIAEGGDLVDLIDQKDKIPEDLVRTLFKGLLARVKSCHDSNVVHGDIKCDNCLLYKEGTLKLADFGFAAFQYGGRLLQQFYGPCKYLAPEVLSLKPYNGYAADVWSTGVVLYFMVYGRLSFDGDSLETVAEQVAQGPSYEPELQVSKSFLDFLKKTLCHNPGEKIITLTGTV